MAIRFANADNASKFKTAFDAAVITVTEEEALKINLEEGAINTTSEESESQKESILSNEPNKTQSPKDSSKDVAEDLKNLSVKEK